MQCLYTQPTITIAPHMPILTPAHCAEKNLVEVNQFILPERVLQFGTGVLLRGLCDYLIDKANKQGIFNGRVMVVKSTTSDASDFLKQAGMYTLHEKGVSASGATVHHKTIITAISRVVNATSQWQDVLVCATSPHLSAIISNTTEVGLAYTPDDIFAHPPQSFPAKLTAVLYQRYRHFNGAIDAGVAIVPTELVVNNAKLLKKFIEQHTQVHHLEAGFVAWLNDACDFCDSLVDRIVTGKLSEQDQTQANDTLGYEDALAIQSEPFLLWAIEGGERVRQRLSFAQSDPRMIIADDIAAYREQKLRLLNGGHTISVALAYLAGTRTVYEAITHPVVGRFIKHVIRNEILPTLVGIAPHAGDFAEAILMRFSNPFIQHQLLSIAFQSSAKMQLRTAITFLRFSHKFGEPPPLMCLGFAAYLLFSRPISIENGQYWGESVSGERYLINDDRAGILASHWLDHTAHSLEALNQFVTAVLNDDRLFDTTLRNIPHFGAKVALALVDLMNGDFINTINKWNEAKPF